MPHFPQVTPKRSYNLSNLILVQIQVEKTFRPLKNNFQQEVENYQEKYRKQSKISNKEQDK